jgi:hypothetical protein
VYQGTIPDAARKPVEAEMLRSLGAPGQTVEQLIAYVLDLRDMVQKITDPWAQQNARARACDIFRRQFASPEANARGRVLAVLHNMLEERDPRVYRGSAARAAAARPPALPLRPERFRSAQPRGGGAARALSRLGPCLIQSTVKVPPLARS